MKRALLSIGLMVMALGGGILWQRPSPARNLAIPTRICGAAHEMEYSVSLGAAPENALKRVKVILAETFAEVDRHFNRWNSLSELSRFNAAEIGTPIALSPPLWRLLQIADRVVHATGGRFDPTIEPARALWFAHLQRGSVPDATALDQMAERCGWRHLQLLPGCRALKTAPIELDLGGIAKGHAVDLIAERLLESDVENFLIDWGGEMRIQGEHPEGRAWRVGIGGPKNLALPEHLLAPEHTPLALATSGSDKQCWSVVEGGTEVCYTHILDPGTLRALRVGSSSPLTCCVLATSCALADGLATAGMLLGDVDAAAKWFEALNLPELRGAWIMNESKCERAERSP